MMFGAETWPLSANLFAFLLGAVVVWMAGHRLALLVDALAERTGLDRAFLGLVLLAGVTELPELVTSLTAVLSGDVPLAVNNLFGGIVMQTAILAVADAGLVAGGLSFFTPRPDVLLQGVLLVLLLSIVLAGVVVGEAFTAFGVGLWTTSAFSLYLIAIWLMRRYEVGAHWRPVDVVEPPREERVDGEGGDPLLEVKSVQRLSVRQLAIRIAIVGVVVLAAGTLLVATSEAIAVQTGLGSSFVGAIGLAATTSLPELSTTLTAVRLRAYGMAFANIFGSNAIMVGLLFVVDVAHRDGPILESVDRSALFAGLAGIFVTGVYLAGLVMRSRRRVWRMGIDSWLVITAYVGTVAVLYALRAG